MREQRPKQAWFETPRREWICHAVKAVVTPADDGWYAYPFDRDVRLGPFASLVEAQLAAEHRDDKDVHA